MDKIFERKVYERKSYPIGDYVFKEGSFGFQAFIVESGEIEILKMVMGREKLLAELIQGLYLAKWR